MKRLILITGVLLIAYVVMISALSPSPGAQTAAISASESSGEPESRGVYSLGVLDDRVAVYLDGALYLKTDTVVSSLPKRDQKKLEEGVSFNSKEELLRLVEDYCS